MGLRRFMNKILGRPAPFDVDAVTSVLRGRSQPQRTDEFRGFNSPPIHVSVAIEESPPAQDKNPPAQEKRGQKPKRKRTAIPTPDRF